MARVLFETSDSIPVAASRFVFDLPVLPDREGVQIPVTTWTEGQPGGSVRLNQRPFEVGVWTGGSIEVTGNPGVMRFGIINVPKRGSVALARSSIGGVSLMFHLLAGTAIEFQRESILPAVVRILETGGRVAKMFGPEFIMNLFSKINLGEARFEILDALRKELVIDMKSWTALPPAMERRARLHAVTTIGVFETKLHALDSEDKALALLEELAELERPDPVPRGRLASQDLQVVAGYLAVLAFGVNKVRFPGSIVTRAWAARPFEKHFHALSPEEKTQAASRFFYSLPRFREIVAFLNEKWTVQLDEELSPLKRLEPQHLSGAFHGIPFDAVVLRFGLHQRLAALMPDFSRIAPIGAPGSAFSEMLVAAKAAIPLQFKYEMVDKAVGQCVSRT